MRAAAIALVVLGAGCAALDEPLRRHAQSPLPEARQCAAWYAALDRETAAEGVGDAQDARIAGFPYLRVNRPLAAFGREAAATEHAFRAWVDRLLELDLAARRHEIANLSAAGFSALADPATHLSRHAALERTRACGQRLRDLDLEQPAVRRALLERAHVPDDYSTLYRVVGVYPVSRIPFGAGVRRFHQEVRSAFRAELTVPEGGSLVRFSPPPEPRLTRVEAAAILRAAANNSLGIPEPSAADLQALIASHAPVFEVETTGDYDRPGALRWTLSPDVPRVDGADVAVYYNASWARYRGRTLLQLAYTIWFSERPPDSAGDLFAGKLDGLTWRVTLAPDGEPLVFDSIHPCGCYHMFFPTPRAHPLPMPDPPPEWRFSPQPLPRPGDDERVVLRVATRTHYLIRVSLERGAESLVRFALRPYDDLRSLGRLDGGRRSAFGPDGLIAGSERAERFLFWPMGIESAGAMRQWGRHPTAFVGRQHFDDADLFEKRFRFDLQ